MNALASRYSDPRQRLLQEAYQRSTGANPYRPWDITAPKENIWGEVWGNPNQTWFTQYNTMGYDPLPGTPEYAITESAKLPGGRSRVTGEQRERLLRNAPQGSAVDTLGRVITPGTILRPSEGGDGGYWTFTGLKQEPYGEPGGESFSDGIDTAWQWTPKGGNSGWGEKGFAGYEPPTAPGNVNLLANLENSGIIPKQMWQGTIGTGGWNSIKALLSMAGSGVLAAFAPASAASSGAAAAANASTAGLSELGALAAQQAAYQTAYNAAMGAAGVSNMIGNSLAAAGNFAAGAAGGGGVPLMTGGFGSAIGSAISPYVSQGLNAISPSLQAATPYVTSGLVGAGMGGTLSGGNPYAALTGGLSGAAGAYNPYAGYGVNALSRLYGSIR